MHALVLVIIELIGIYKWIVVATVVLSWLTAFNVINTQHRAVYVIGDFLFRATEPVLKPIRNLLPNFGGIDISPVILWVLLFFLQQVLIDNLL